ncbi:lysophospholipid acyltransferase family protein [Ktedonospora formicarum]|uniref:1-acyl-sn-glycerol-3-phosphate acyltransferase n=1 Tax=Ktedonospora formicarum TaxID=2778364 RepID=A0A8J3HYJ4_9CHLR|nr:lysophospholipid acyltransferase family protein [Ktedonospora formicarum]GHO43373.1 1-acyl-sn-glycerol-3-phosphate acyltransferase [Ktedonospora formicarum]
MVYRLLAFIARLILPCFFRIHITGEDHVPSEGRVVLTCNHTSWLDVLFLAYATLPRPIHYMAKKELFKQALVAWFLRSLHAFPVDRQKPGPSVLKNSLAILENGDVLGIFPSGTRTNEDTALKQGAVTIALRAQAPLIAAVYRGPLRWKLSYLFRRPSVTLHFWPALSSSHDGEDRKQAQMLLMQRLSERLTQEPQQTTI